MTRKTQIVGGHSMNECHMLCVTSLLRIRFESKSLPFKKQITGKVMMNHLGTPSGSQLTQIALSFAVTIAASKLNAAEPLIQFDLPTTASAVMDPVNLHQGRVTLRLSSMIHDPSAPEIDQWIVTCRPRQSELRVVDYLPKTETASDLASPMTIKKFDETNSSLGLSIDGSYAHFARGNVGTDQSKKSTQTLEYSKVAPVQAVSVSGTIAGGRGVYFKLRWTATQVLEGEKEFQITLRVPASWRGGLIDVTAEAMRSEKRLGSFSKQPVVVGAARFVVAVYPAGDLEAEQLAHALAKREYALQKIASQQPLRESPLDSLSSIVRYAARKIQGDRQGAQVDHRWLARLLVGRADPHLDREIVKLPMPLRLAALDYADARDDFQFLADTSPSPDTSQPDKVYVSQPTLSIENVGG